MSTFTVDPLSSVWNDINLHAIGGLYSAQFPYQVRDYAQLIREVTLTESVSEAAMRMELTLDNFDPGLLAPFHVGSWCVFFGHTIDSLSMGVTGKMGLFSGRVFLDSRDDSESDATRSYVAYDVCTYLARNEDIFVFNNMTLTQIFRQCCEAAGLPMGRVDETFNPVGQIVMGPNYSLWAALQEAIQRTWRLGERRYFVRAADGPTSRVVELIELGTTGPVWNLHDGPGGVITAAHLEDSAESLYTRVNVVVEEPSDSDEGGLPDIDAPNQTRRIVTKSYAEASGAVRETFGRLQKFVAPDNFKQRAGLGVPVDHIPTLAELGEDARYELDRRAHTIFKATLSGLMLPGLRRGDRVLLHERRVGTASQWYVDTMTMRYSEGPPEMSLELVYDPEDAGGGLL